MSLDTYTFVGDGSTTQFTLPAAPLSANALLATVSGILKTPSVDYTLAGTVVTFSTPPGSGAPIAIRNFSAADETPANVPDGSATLPGMRFANSQSSGVFRPVGSAVSISAGGAEQLRVSKTDSASRYITITGSTGSGNPTIGTNAGKLAFNRSTYINALQHEIDGITDTATQGVRLKSNGGAQAYNLSVGADAFHLMRHNGTDWLSAITVQPNGSITLGNTVGAESLNVTATPSAVNALTVSGAAAGGAPKIMANGADTSINIDLQTKGAGSIRVFTNGGAHEQLRIVNTDGADRHISITGAAGGNPTISTSAGDLNLTSNAGAVNVTGNLTVNGADIPTGCQNLGTGAAVYYDQSGSNLRFRSLKAGANTIISTSATEVTIASTSPWFDVKAYGAVGNGSADDTAAIQAAVNAAQSAGGGCVFFPAGNFKITAPITISQSDISLLGLGYKFTKVKVTQNPGNGFTINGPVSDPNQYISNISIKGLWIAFDGNGSPHSSGAAIRIYFTRNVTISECCVSYFHQFLSLGHHSYENSVIGITVDNSVIVHSSTEAQTDCIDLISGAILTVSNCFFNGSNGNDIATIGQRSNAKGDEQNWDGLVVSGCTVENFSRFIVTTGEGITNARIIGNICEPSVQNAGISLFPRTSCANWSITSNVISCRTGEVAYTDSFGIRLSQALGGNVENISISANTILYTGDSGIRVDNFVDSVAISGNTLKNCGWNEKPAIMIGASTSAIVVCGNTIIRTNSNCLMTYGIQWEGTGDGPGVPRAQAGNAVVNPVTGVTSGTP